MTRDDTTGTTRQIASEVLGVRYDDVKPTLTLVDLGCSESELVELIRALEQAFGISITESDLQQISDHRDVRCVSVLALANLARAKCRRH